MEDVYTLEERKRDSEKIKSKIKLGQIYLNIARIYRGKPLTTKKKWEESIKVEHWLMLYEHAALGLRGGPGIRVEQLFTHFIDKLKVWYFIYFY